MAKGKKTGGRQAGTPNKVSAEIRGVIGQLLDNYFNSEDFENDIKALKPVERVAIIEKFTGYVTPKLQAATLDAKVEKTKTIEDKLLELSGESEDEK